MSNILKQLKAVMFPVDSPSFVVVSSVILFPFPCSLVSVVMINVCLHISVSSCFCYLFFFWSHHVFLINFVFFSHFCSFPSTVTVTFICSRLKLLCTCTYLITICLCSVCCPCTLFFSFSYWTLILCLMANSSSFYQLCLIWILYLDFLDAACNKSVFYDLMFSQQWD